MTPDQAIQKIAQRARYDLFFLAKEVLGYELMEEEVHGDLCRMVEAFLPSHPPEYRYPEIKEGKGMEDQFNPKNKNALILMPRGTFKSSVVTIGFTLQILLNEPDVRVLIDSETYAKGKAFLMEIKGHLEKNEFYRKIFHSIHGVYPDGVSTKRNKDLLWTNNEIVLASRKRPLKEPSVMVSGIDKSINGLHYDYIICDDLHSEKNVTNKEQIDQVIQHWKLCYSLLDPGKYMLVIGTRWDYNDLYQEILDYHRDSHNIIIRQAIKEDGEALFPSRLPLETLKEIKQKQGAGHFSNQYMNLPISSEDADFKREDIQRIDWDLVKNMPMNWYLFIDPSFAGPTSDFAALVLAGMNHMRQIYVRNVLRKKMVYSEIIDAIFDLNNKFSPKTIYVKSVSAGGKSFMYELNNEQKRRGVWLSVRELRDNKNSKEERIRALSPLYQFHNAFHVKECPQIDELEYELLHFPKGKHDDIVDALSSILEVATPPNSKVQVYKEDGKNPKSFKPRSMITKV